jgi:hypothetical protein
VRLAFSTLLWNVPIPTQSDERMRKLANIGGRSTGRPSAATARDAQQTPFDTAESAGLVACV